MTYKPKTIGWNVFEPLDGPVAQMQIPGDWKKEPNLASDTQLQVHETSAEFFPQHNPSVKLFFCWTDMLSEQETETLQELLSKQRMAAQPRDLTIPEIKSLGQIIGVKSDPEIFELRNIFTNNWYGVPVLFVEGQFLSTGVCGIGMTMLSDTAGPPFDLYLEAPENPRAPEAASQENLYAHYRSVAMQIFHSVIWKKDYIASFGKLID